MPNPIDQEAFRLEDLFRSLRCGIYTLTPQRSILRWEGAATLLSGYAPEEVIGHCCADNLLRHVDVAGRNLCLSACPVAQSFKDGRARESQVFLHHKDGFRVPITVRCHVLRDAAGQMDSAVECFSDSPLATSLRRHQAALEAQGYLDPLTRIPSPALLEAYLSQLEALHHQRGWPYVYFLANLDRSQDLDNQYGTDAAGKVLRMIAQTALYSLNGFDFIAFSEGDTFAGTLFNVDAPLARDILNRTRVLIEQSFIKTAGAVVSATCSFGGACARPGLAPAVIREQARAALKESKARGRNRVTVLDEALL